MEMVSFPILSPDKINIAKVSPSQEEIVRKAVKEQESEPIKDIKDIERIRDYLLKNERYRDNLLFIMGINFGLRISDLRILRLGELITDEGIFRKEIILQEKKTSETKKRPVNRHIYVNKAVREAVCLYVNNLDGQISLSDYLFRSQSNRSGNVNSPLTVRSANRILHKIADTLQLNIRFSTHSLRKTFGYHQMRLANNDPRMLLLLQRIFNHSTPQQTLTYIGFTEGEIQDCYENLNLGLINAQDELKEEMAYKEIV